MRTGQCNRTDELVYSYVVNQLHVGMARHIIHGTCFRSQRIADIDNNIKTK
jgi:hypothetical protein